MALYRGGFLYGLAALISCIMYFVAWVIKNWKCYLLSFGYFCTDVRIFQAVLSASSTMGICALCLFASQTFNYTWTRIICAVFAVGGAITGGGAVITYIYEQDTWSPLIVTFTMTLSWVFAVVLALELVKK